MLSEQQLGAYAPVPRLQDANGEVNLARFQRSRDIIGSD